MKQLQIIFNFNYPIILNKKLKKKFFSFFLFIMLKIFLFAHIDWRLDLCRNSLKNGLINI